jgi:hypothetical protein
MEYLPYEVTEQTDAIEKIIAKKLFEKPRAKKMSDLESRFFLIGIIDDGQEKDDAETEEMYEDLLKSSLQMMLIKKKFDAVNLKYSKSSLIWLGIISDRPATAILNAIHVISESKNWVPEKFDRVDCKWLSEIFASGIFEDKDLEEVWDAQKVERLNDGSFSSDNLVDYPITFSSLIRE